ncbi:MAG: ABC transporter ATP-binding protein, partial [Sedimentisphaerales bacterium]|nr:ABC transporter ATP-binding protein [Sedimentisphaerales bacterium]
LDLEVKRHEIFGLLGPNGSGKSTTIKMLLGLLNPSRGWARVLGKNPGDVKTNARIGYLPEESFLYPFLNAKETLDFYGRLFGLSAEQRESRTKSLLDMVGLSATASRSVGEFSKGMQRRVGLAQALINDPEVLILDEPTSGMDPIGTRQIKDLIIELGKRGKTILLCSHLMADVEDVCDRICILYGGKVRASGSLDELLSRTEMTRIVSEKLDDKVIAEIKSVIARHHPEYDLQFETPRDRMEDFFLRTVEQAQLSDIATSGAKMGGVMSDFLGSEFEQKDNVIDKLVQVEKTPVAGNDKQETTQVVSVEKAKADDALISSLTAPKEEELTVRVEKTQAQPESKPEVDLNIIDGLLGRKDKKNEQ